MPRNALVPLLFVVAGCGSSSTPSDPSTTDSTPDTSPSDAFSDVLSDAASDTPPETSPETSPDALLDSDATRPPITDIAASGVHSCAVSADGRLRCWGDNREGQLGDGTTTQRLTPTDVPGIAGATAVSASNYHTCAIVTGGGVRCWGNNYNGVLGDGTTTRSLVPLVLAKITGATSITTGSGHSCAILGDTTLQCWGSNYYGQLGDPKAVNPSTPVAVVGLTGVIAVGTGNGFTCAALADGTASCWGAGSEGEFGDGTYTFSRATPGPVKGLTTVKGITAGTGHVCALLADGTARCWGSNSGGALGDGKTYTTSSNPVTVLGLSNGKAIQAFASRTCVLLGDGTVTCWGPTLTPVAGLSGVTKFAAGGCAIVGVGVKCWGSNASGQLGDGTMTSSATPVSVVGLP